MAYSLDRMLGAGLILSRCHSIRLIAKKMGMHRNTAKKFIEGRCFPAGKKYAKLTSDLTPGSLKIFRLTR
jgi:hypothetical protein